MEEVNPNHLINDKQVNDLSPKDRNIAMVFQSYALYPHMTVFDNMAFGLKLEKRSNEEINERVLDAAKTLQIQDYLKVSLNNYQVVNDNALLLEELHKKTSGFSLMNHYLTWMLL